MQEADFRTKADALGEILREGRVYVIDEKIVSSPTFRFAEGVRELARMLYPGILDGGA